MASVCCGLFDIDYSIVDGRIRSFELNGELVFDEKRKINPLDWKERCQAVVIELGLDKDDGRGLHAFIEPLFKEETRQ